MIESGWRDYFGDAELKTNPWFGPEDEMETLLVGGSKEGSFFFGNDDICRSGDIGGLVV